MSQNFSILWVTDPWDTLSHLNDTTLRLMNETRKMGVASYWSSSHFILNSSSTSCLLVDSEKNSGSTKVIEMEPSKFHHLHYRIDPPVDFNYISLLDQLIARGVREEQIVNPPKLLKTQSEKIPPAELREHCPLFAPALHKDDVMNIQTLFKHHDTVVTKPLNTAQSIGVKKFTAPKTSEAWLALLEAETLGFTRPVVVQEFLPEISKGEVRVWFANGEIIAALKKHPAKNDFRVLIDEGSKIEAYELSGAELKVAQAVGAALKKQRASLAAVDLIGGKISDYNITSPGLLVQLEKVHGGKNFAREIIEKTLSGIF